MLFLTLGDEIEELDTRRCETFENEKDFFAYVSQEAENKYREVTGESPIWSAGINTFTVRIETFYGVASFERETKIDLKAMSPRMRECFFDHVFAIASGKEPKPEQDCFADAELAAQARFAAGIHLSE